MFTTVPSEGVGIFDPS